jgi:hypothetical protein
MSGFSSDDEDWNGSAFARDMISEVENGKKADGGKKRAADGNGLSASKRRGSVSSNASVKASGWLSSGMSAISHRQAFEPSRLRVADGISDKHIYAPYTASAAPKHVAKAPLTDTPSTTSVPVTGAQAPLVGPIDLQQQVTALQDQLKVFAQTLAVTSADSTGYPQSATDRQLNELRQTIYNLENRNKVLHMANERLRNKNTELESNRSSMADELSRLTDEQALDAGPNERSRTCIGIDPGLIRDLAAALSTGDRSAPSIAEELFTVAESAIPYAGIEDVRRESFAPRERLRNVEGVLDVSLARMEMMEAKMRVLSERSRIANLDVWGSGAIKKDVMQLSSGGNGQASSKESDWEQGTQTGKSSFAAGA